MQRLTIEMGKSSERPCACCGNTTRTVWGYVHAYGNAHAVYYAMWTQGHLERGLSFALSIGGWGEGANEADRQMVALECRINENGPGFMVIDAATSQLAAALLGLMLDRQEVLASPAKQEAFDIIDRIIVDDPRIQSFIAQPAS